jgi:hypothetical protein
MIARIRSPNDPGELRGDGFALVTVLWLAMLGFLGTAFLLGMMGSRRQALQKARVSLENRLALEEAIGRITAEPDLLPSTWESIRDTLLTVGDPPRPIRVETRR